MKPSGPRRVSRHMRQPFVAVVSVVAVGAAVIAAGTLAWHVTSRPVQAANAAPVPVVVELFTSEGCSSCPPADQLLMELSARPLVPGAQVITLSEHVDYWDNLGWRDPFSKAAFTDRQTSYSHTTGDGSYTPQMIVDGQRSFVGSDRDEATSAIARAAGTPKAPLDLTWSATNPLTLSIALGANAPSASASIIVAVTEDGLKNAVTRGENAGHTIAHTSVVRRLSDIGQARKDGSFSLKLPVTIDAAWLRQNVRIVVFAQASKSARITAAGEITLSPVPAGK